MFSFFRYFDRLQQDLEGYDCVLYEMVTSQDNLNNPKGPMAAKKMKSSRRGFSILGFIQKQMARILSLDYQLDCLDYGNAKWQHADLDYETFKQLQVTVLSSYVTIVFLIEMFTCKISGKTLPFYLCFCYYCFACHTRMRTVYHACSPYLQIYVYSFLLVFPRPFLLECILNSVPSYRAKEVKASSHLQ